MPDAPEGLSSRKHQSGQYTGSQEIYGGLDQRQQADAAYRDLRRCFQELFEAEDDLSRQSAAVPVVILTNDQEATLSTLAHQKVHPLIQKAITFGCFRHVPPEDLLRIQRLCDGSIKHAGSLDLRIDEAAGETEVDLWARQLPDVDAGLKAARTSLRIMCGGHEDRQLYSEDIIQSAVDLFKGVMDGIVVPVAELRSSGPTERLFKQLSSHKKSITTVFTSCQRLFALMANLAASIELSETVINTLEFAASHLIFVENAHAERDSVLGVQKFDGIRLAAMDMLCQIFLMNPDQRQGIFDDILTSLEKLPVGKQSARQFKLVDGRSIQPVSALIMRLVQASAGKVEDAKAKSRSKVLQSLEDDDVDELAAGGPAVNPQAPSGDATGVTTLATITSESRAAAQHATAVQELMNVVNPLNELARRNASYVINFIVNRALKSTKSGDTPYRNLLDLFVEDFTACMDSPDWPAAELLLRLLMLMMVKLVEGEKQSAPAKNMALEILGVLGAAISKLRSYVRTSGNANDGAEMDELSIFLADLAASALELKSQPELMVAWTGPYRAALEYVQGRCSEDPHLASAVSFLISDWASKVCSAYDAIEPDYHEHDQELGRLAYRLRMMIEDRRWLSSEYSFKAVSANQAKLALSVTLVRSPLCESFAPILNILLGSMSSDQATVRSKSLRSINQVLETDPSILDGDSVVVERILQCSSDSSTQVRDSALGLVGKSITMRPNLEEKMLPTVIERFVDTGVGVRKRAMKLARDVYLRNPNRQVRSAIANGLLLRVQDPDESVRELARQTMEEIWIFPFVQGEGTAAYKTSLDDHVALMVQTVKNGSVTPVLDKVLQTILSPEAKTAKANFDVCKRLVASMFDLVDNPDSDDPAAPSGRNALQVLMIFAKADPRLFTFEQIRLLKPHISSVGSSEDVAVSRAAVVIYCRVLPQLSSVHSQFLADVRKDLLPATSKVSRALLDDVISCLWIISDLLGTTEHLARLVSSSVSAIHKLRIMSQTQPLDDKKMKQFNRYTLIVGMAGKHCDLDKHLDQFKSGFPRWQGTSVSKLMVDVVIPFAKPTFPPEVRKSALDAVGLICQSWPRNYVTPNVYSVFQDVFEERDAILETMIMRSLKEFLTTEEMRSEVASAASKAQKTAGADAAKKRELTVMGGTNHDDVASATTQRFLAQLTRIALATLDGHALLATEILGSINRQGLVHPKETGVTMITLETSPVPRISELAFHEHRALHGKHETVLEREYVKAIQSAFQYQRDIVRDTRGATTGPFTAKLHLLMEVLKDSRSKNRQRLLDKMITQVDFEPNRLDVSQAAMPAHVDFSRFVIENLAFFEYLTVGEVQSAVSLMEKVVHSTGATVAHAIESEIFRVRMEIEPTFQLLAEDQDGQVAAPPQPAIDAHRLRQLTAASMVLLLLWEARTYLRKLYSLRREKGKAPAKDLSRAPLKVQSVTGDKFWDDSAAIMTALASEASMLDQCKTFVELLNVDKEFKVADEDDDMNNGDDPATPSGDEGGDPSNDRGRKRKASNTPGSRKKRPRSSSQPRKRGRPRKSATQDEDAEGELFDDNEWL